ncbi:MAG: hypothetical protein WCH43_14235, partial [Verrucomicrobiota bacterium]
MIRPPKRLGSPYFSQGTLPARVPNKTQSFNQDSAPLLPNQMKDPCVLRDRVEVSLDVGIHDPR